MKSCLIVDDSRVIRMVARKILTELGFTTIDAADGRAALEQCQKKHARCGVAGLEHAGHVRD